MMKKCIKIFLIICSFLIITNTVNAESLKEIKDELAKNKAEQSSIIARQKDVAMEDENSGEIMEEIERNKEKQNPNFEKMEV